MIQKKILTPSSEITRRIFGSFDCHARRLEESFGIRMYNTSDSSEGDCIMLEGE